MALPLICMDFNGSDPNILFCDPNILPFVDREVEQIKENTTWCL